MFLFLYKGKNYKSRFCKWRIIYIWGIIYIWSIRATVAITAEDSENHKIKKKIDRLSEMIKLTICR